MNYLNSIIDPHALATVINSQVFVAVLLALLVYRLVAPVIDFLNPFIMLIGGFFRLKEALAHRAKNYGAPHDPRRPGDDLKVVR